MDRRFSRMMFGPSVPLPPSLPGSRCNCNGYTLGAINRQCFPGLWKHRLYFQVIHVDRGERSVRLNVRMASRLAKFSFAFVGNYFPFGSNSSTGIDQFGNVINSVTKIIRGRLKFAGERILLKN